MKEAADDMNITAITHISDILFEVNGAATSLNATDDDYFQRMMEQLLFESKRAQHDIKVAVVFLYIKVKGPNIDN